MAVLSEETFGGSKISKARNKDFKSKGIMCITVAETDAGKFGWKSLHYYTQVEAAAGLLLIPSVRLGLNPGELIDFVLGWTTLDIFQDDLEAEKDKQEETGTTSK